MTLNGYSDFVEEGIVFVDFGQKLGKVALCCLPILIDHLLRVEVVNIQCDDCELS